MPNYVRGMLVGVWTSGTVYCLALDGLTAATAVMIFGTGFAFVGALYVAIKTTGSEV